MKTRPLLSLSPTKCSLRFSDVQITLILLGVLPLVGLHYNQNTCDFQAPLDNISQTVSNTATVTFHWKSQTVIILA